MKICPGCETLLDFCLFGRDRNKTDGFTSCCRDCLSKARRKRHLANPEIKNSQSRNYYAKNREQHCALTKRWYSKNKESHNAKSKLRYLERKDTVLARHKTWRILNKERNRFLINRWFSNNPGARASISAKRRASLLQRTPAWLSQSEFRDIRLLYCSARRLSKLTGIAFEVDHILPLQGKYVSGLHVFSNLQIMIASHNRIKFNNWKPS